HVYLPCAAFKVQTLLKAFTFSGAYSGGATPVPIPNTAVKPSSADGTARATERESRSVPENFFRCARLSQSRAAAFPGSSMAEHSAVNRGVAGSSPARGARFQAADFGGFLFCRGPAGMLRRGCCFSREHDFRPEPGFSAHPHASSSLLLIDSPAHDKTSRGQGDSRAMHSRSSPSPRLLSVLPSRLVSSNS